MEEARAPEAGRDEEITPSDDERIRFKAVVDIFIRLSIACKSRSLYPGDHPAALDAVEILYHILAEALEGEPSITVQVGRDSFIYGDLPLGQRSESLRQVASRIRSHNIQEITFRSGLSREDIVALVDLLVSDPEEVDGGGGAATCLLVKGVECIGVVESEAQRARDREEEEGGSRTETLVEVDADTAARPEGPLSQKDLDFLALLMNPEELALALEQLPGQEDFALGKEAMAEAVFMFLKDAYAFVDESHPERGQQICRSMAESLLFLDGELRNFLLQQHMFPKIDEEPACAGIMGRFNVQETADLLGSFLSTCPELLPRVRHFLQAAGYADRDAERAVVLLKVKLIDLAELPPSAISALDDEGPDSEAGHKLLTLEEISASFSRYGPDEIAEIRRISELDIAREALLDTTPMLLDLLTHGGKLDNLGIVVETLQHNFWDLLGSARLAPAADILHRIGLVLAGEDHAIDPYRSDLRRFVEEASSQRVMGHAIRLSYARRSDPKTAEGFRRFASSLGEGGVRAMIESLGVEEEMTVRKYIIDILTDLSEGHVNLLGVYTNDPRWYLVRNMVTIMARIRSAETLPYLRTTFEHPNQKVRAETIRALGMTGGYEAGELLMRGLQSPDEQTRTLCIRWLGRLEESRAVGKLVRMLEEKDPGAEGLAVKREIIICLGEIRSPDSYEVLKRFRDRQKRINRSEWQEINELSQQALYHLLEKYPHLGRKR